MNPVVGLDLEKGEIQVQVCLDQSKPYGKSLSIDFLKEIEGVTGKMHVVILESTRHYHTPVIQFLEEQGVLYILQSPLFLIRQRSPV